jgi:hypothetical protein
MTAQAAEAGILSEAAVYTASSRKGRLTHWTGYIDDRRSMRVVWHAGPPTVYGPQSEWPTVCTAEAFAWDNAAGQRLVAAIRGSGDDNGKDGEGGSDHLAKAISVVNETGQQNPPQWVKWLKRKLDLASVPLPVKPKIRKQTVTRRVGPCKKCHVPGCFTGTFLTPFHCFLNLLLQVSVVPETGFWKGYTQP